MKTSISTLLLQWPDFISNAEKNIWLTKGVIYIPLSMVWIRIFEGSLSFLRSKTLQTNGDIFSPWFLHSKIFCLRSNLYIVDKILYVDLMQSYYLYLLCKILICNCNISNISFDSYFSNVLVKFSEGYYLMKSCTRPNFNRPVVISEIWIFPYYFCMEYQSKMRQLSKSFGGCDFSVFLNIAHVDT